MIGGMNRLFCIPEWVGLTFFVLFVAAAMLAVCWAMIGLGKNIKEKHDTDIREYMLMDK
jgi:predicted small secreted protein